MDVFCKFLATNFLSKGANMFGDFWGNLENHHFSSQTRVANFWATFEENLDNFLYHHLVTLHEINIFKL